MRVTLSLAVLFLSTSAIAAPIAYPETRRVDVVETQFGVKVADPYRWLENDVRNDPEVRAWVDAENAVTSQYLAGLPLREAFKAKLTALYDYERYAIPEAKGGRLFYTRNDGLQNQSVLYVRGGADAAGRVLIDPNGWSKDGATALAEWTPSEDGKLLSYAIQDGGTDWRTVRLLDVDSGKLLPDELKGLKFGGEVSWARDGKGFYYSRYPEVAPGATYQSLNKDQKIYFHRLGDPQAADRLVYATPDHPEYSHGGRVTEDGRWLVVDTSPGSGDRNQVTLIDLGRPGAKPRTLIKGFTDNYSFVGNQGSTFYFLTDNGAPKQRLIAMDAAAPNPKARTVIAEDSATLDRVSMVGGKLVARYLVDARSEVRVHDLSGKLLRKVDLPGIGSASGFGGEMADKETYYSFSSFNRPTTIYRYDIATGQTSTWAAPKVPFNPDDVSVEQRFYASKDGTRVPMFIIRRKDITGPAPTLLYGYGGFNISMTPSYSAKTMAWVQQGGTYVVANLRGGGEYGKAWHDAGRLANKQHVFDDFIAAGEALIATGVTGKNQLAVAGGSNGGLLVGAVVNQRPDLFAAANPAVGVMDMLRFDRFTAGRFWVDDYGVPAKEADFRTLWTYSPYHNVKGGRPYPAVLVTTADTDDRVVPGHSFKYISALQAAPDTGDKPHLIRIETRAGHGSGKPTSKIIEEGADVYAFLGHFTGMDPAEAQSGSH